MTVLPACAFPVAFLGLVLATSCAEANPQGGTVVGGQATISQPAPNNVTVKQQSPKAIIDWRSFSIGGGESVLFSQPSPSSVALNRVIGNDLSSIAGSLSANGIVFLVNPNGVVFTRTAKVDVNGLIATTSDIANSDFMAGKFNFTVPGLPGSGVVNEGTITAAQGGLVGLVAPWVRNDGVISARLGRISLVSGDAFTVDLYGDQLIQFAVPVVPTNDAAPANGALITNTGTISAKGGTVTLTADTAQRIVDQAINTTGLVEASAVREEGGEIVLDGGAGGGVQVAGALDASGKTGGTVKILGANVALNAGARIDVSGDAGGGTALIGGNFHGAGPERNAVSTTVASGATINANALASGDGGHVAVWSEQQTIFNGLISARGGTRSGDGGFVETSSSNALSSQTGVVDTFAPNGQTGSWLLDPLNIWIISGGTSTLSSASPFGSNPSQLEQIDPSVINSSLTNVTLQAASSIDFMSPISMSHDFVGITAQAGGGIAVHASITTRGGAILLSANDPGGTVDPNADIYVGAPISTNGGGLVGGSVTLRAYDNGVLIAGSQTITTAGGSVTTGNVSSTSPYGTLLYGPDANTNTTLTIDTTGGGAYPAGAPITFSSGLYGNFWDRQFVTLSAGTSGDIAFEGNSGIGGITIVSARNVSAGNYVGAGFFTDTNQTGNLTLPFGLFTYGDGAFDFEYPGAENAGPINIHTGGNVSIGTDENSFVVAAGGYSSTGKGGNGASVTIFAAGTVTLAGVDTNGGSPQYGSTQGGNGGSISITGSTVYLMGYSPETISGVPGVYRGVLFAAGGPNSSTNVVFANTVAGTGGTITINGNVVLEGGAGAGVLVDNTSNGPATNIVIKGTVNADSPGAETLLLEGGHGLISAGNIGNATPLDEVIIHNNVTGSFGSVSANELIRSYFPSSVGATFGNSSTTFNGPVNVDTALLSGNEFNFNGGLNISGAASIGSANLNATHVSIGGPTIILGSITTPMGLNTTVINTSVDNGTITMASIDGSTPFGQYLTLNAGSAGIVNTGPVGHSVPLASFTVIQRVPPARNSESQLQLIVSEVESDFSLAHFDAALATVQSDQLAVGPRFAIQDNPQLRSRDASGWQSVQNSKDVKQALNDLLIDAGATVVGSQGFASFVLQLRDAWDINQAAQKGDYVVASLETTELVSEVLLDVFKIAPPLALGLDVAHLVATIEGAYWTGFAIGP